jgi:hypothetical protein
MTGTPVMASRIDRRRARATHRQRIAFLDPNATIAAHEQSAITGRP